MQIPEENTTEENLFLFGGCFWLFFPQYSTLNRKNDVDVAVWTLFWMKHTSVKAQRLLSRTPKTIPGWPPPSVTPTNHPDSEQHELHEQLYSSLPWGSSSAAPRQSKLLFFYQFPLITFLICRKTGHGTWLQLFNKVVKLTGRMRNVLAEDGPGTFVLSLMSGRHLPSIK